MKREKGIITLFVILVLLIIVAVGLVAAKPAIERIQRALIQKQLMDEIKNGSTEITLTDVPTVEGAEDEFSDAEEGSKIRDRLPSIEVTGYAVIEIPAIDLAMPVVKGTDANSLCAAAGWYTESAEIGSAGNAVILGHRMYGYGEHFNRLDEVQVGDEIIITLSNYEYYTYTVTGTEVVLPDLLMDTLEKHTEGFCLTLVTCTPTGIGSHRLLVYAELADFPN